MADNGNDYEADYYVADDEDEDADDDLSLSRGLTSNVLSLGRGRSTLHSQLSSPS